MSLSAIELYFDEDVNPLIGKLLQPRGFSFVTTQMVGSLQASDAEQLSRAVADQKTLLTHNRVDFETLACDYFQSDKVHFGIIIAVRRPPQQVARRLLVILNSSSREEMKNQLIYI